MVIYWLFSLRMTQENYMGLRNFSFNTEKHIGAPIVDYGWSGFAPTV